MIRKVGLFAVMLGALALSFNGQREATAPLLGSAMAIVFALTTDLASLLALNEVTSTTDKSVRRWAWSVLLLAGGTALGLNTWHALSSGKLPPAAAIAVGTGPVVLAWLLSHMVALALQKQAAKPTTVTAIVETPEPVSAPAELAAVVTAASIPQIRKQATGAGKVRRSAKSDDELLRVLADADQVERDDDGSVPVRRAARVLGCGPDRARRLLEQLELLRTNEVAA